MVSNNPVSLLNSKANGRSIIVWGSFSLLIGVGFLIFVCFYTNLLSFLGAWRYFCIFLFCAGFTFSLSEIFRRTIIPIPWVYRSSFLSGAILAITSGIYWLVVDKNGLAALTWIGLGCAGAFCGGLLETSWRLGWWEDNLPPTETTKKEVLQWHQTIQGDLPSPSWAKRVFDLSLSLVGVVFTLPLFLLCIWLLWMEDPGPIFFVKNVVGRGGKNFRLFKFRSMLREAESLTGPVLSEEKDERVLFVGRILRKTALDELPQLINILLGEMSFVGPRPQRTELVHRYLQELPEYTERHQVLPGLSGLAQVVGSYYLSPRQKLRLDRLYVKNVNLGFDVKLILLAIGVTFYLRWKKDWNGRLPRTWLHKYRKQYV